MMLLLLSGIYFPMINLPFYVLSGHELGNVNIALEILSTIYIFYSWMKIDNRKKSRKFVTLLWATSLLALYGLLNNLSQGSLIIKLIGLKLLVLPIIFGSVFIFDSIKCLRIIKSLLYIQILNAIFVVIEFILGGNYLLKLGLEYGTNIRDFNGMPRLSGLALTNYILGSFSAVILLFVYFKITNYSECNFRIQRKLLVLTALCSFINLLGSNFRSGLLFSIIGIIALEFFTRGRVVRSFILFWLTAIVLCIAVLNNSLFINTFSLNERIEKWSHILVSFNSLTGVGIGSTGAASNSSFAMESSRVITDNQFITFLIQYGLLGGLYLALITYLLFKEANPFGKSMLIALFTSMIFVEIWDLTTAMSLIFFFYFKFGNSVRNNSA